MTFPCYIDGVSLQVSFHTLYNLSLPETYLGQMKEVPGSSGDSLSLLMGKPQQTQACGCPVAVTAALAKAVMTVMLGGHTVDRTWLLRRAFMLHIRKRKAEESSQDYAKYILKCFSFSSLV